MYKMGPRKILKMTSRNNCKYRHMIIKFSVFILSFLPTAAAADNSSSGILTDIESLMAFRAAADLDGALQSWIQFTNPCENTNSTAATAAPGAAAAAAAAGAAWVGIRCNQRNRVAGVSLPSSYLRGTFAENTLSKLDELRYLNLANNSFTGSLPNDLWNATGLMQLWAQNAGFSGQFPEFLKGSKRLKLVKMDLSGNHFTGPIPDLSDLAMVTLLNLSGNALTGTIPPLPSNLSILDLSSNSLSGSIPSDLAERFTNASFEGNAELCGPPISVPCPSSPSGPTAVEAMVPAAAATLRGKKKLSPVSIALIVVADLMAMIFIIVALAACYSRNYSKKTINNEKLEIASCKDSAKAVMSGSINVHCCQVGMEAIPESEQPSDLSFLDDCSKYDLEGLLRAPAEMLGKGSFGTTYKVVLENGTTVAVKRLKDVKDVEKTDFDQQMQILGKLRHPNLLPLRAFYYARQEKLLVYDFMSNGSLFALLHGNRGPRRTALEWTPRLRIANGVASGLTYLHQRGETQNIAHGNLKSSNVLVGRNFEVCISDFGLYNCMTATMAAQRLAPYQAAPRPDNNQTEPIGQTRDVYCFGILLLELLTGRQPAAPSLEEDGMDLSKWVQSVLKDDESKDDIFDMELRSNGRNFEGEMVALLQIAKACVTLDPEKRPEMADIVNLIQGIRPGRPVTDVEESDSSLLPQPQRDLDLEASKRDRDTQQAVLVDLLLDQQQPAEATGTEGPMTVKAESDDSPFTRLNRAEQGTMEPEPKPKPKPDSHSAASKDNI